jgi:undecaprenyl-diphosphatase
MNYFYAMIFGAIQGATEFLPISSSGHLLILHRFIKLPINNDLSFDVALHLATLLAVMIFFRKEIFLIIRSVIKSIFGKPDEYSRIGWLIVIATIPAALAGVLFENWIENQFRSPFLVAVMLALVGALFILFENKSAKKQEIKALTWKKSLIIGLSQAIALIPGTSRSGVTIIAGLWSDLKREEAVKFSFLLAIPIIAGASLKKLPELFKADSSDLLLISIAFIFAFASGWLAIKYFLNFSRNHSLKIFAYYRFVLAAFIFVYFLFNFIK